MYRGSRAGAGRRRGRGERVLQGFGLGLLFLLRSNQIRQGEKGFEDLLDTRERSQQILVPPLGRFALEEKERKLSLQGLWYAWPSSKSKFEIL
jgi:hypothetical protein